MLSLCGFNTFLAWGLFLVWESLLSLFSACAGHDPFYSGVQVPGLYCSQGHRAAVPATSGVQDGSNSCTWNLCRKRVSGALRRKEAPMAVAHISISSPAMAPCFSDGSRHLRTPSMWCTTPWLPQGCHHIANPSPPCILSMETGVWYSAPPPASRCVSQAGECCQAGGTSPLCSRPLSRLSSADWLKPFLFHSLLPRVQVPYHSSLLFFVSQLHGDFLALVEVWDLPAFSRWSVVLSNVGVFFTYLWERVSSLFYSSAFLIQLHPCFMFV